MVCSRWNVKRACRQAALSPCFEVGSRVRWCTRWAQCTHHSSGGLKVLWLDVEQDTWTQVVDAWPFLGCAMKTRLELHEQREQKPKANCVEAERPELELHEQR